MIHRHYEPTIPPQVTYSLTERGKKLSQALDHLYELAVSWYGTKDKSSSC
ncbi:winged helix-turn-helix transcriptional regulator [Scytonema hofmannii]